MQRGPCTKFGLPTIYPPSGGPIFHTSRGGRSALPHETRTTPIVFVTVSDPLGDGFHGTDWFIRARAQVTAHSQTCDRGPKITREHVKKRRGTRTYATDFSGRWPTYCKSSGTVFSVGDVSHDGRMEPSTTLPQYREGMSPPGDV